MIGLRNVKIQKIFPCNDFRTRRIDRKNIKNLEIQIISYYGSVDFKCHI